MTGESLKEFTEELLGGESIGSTKFYYLLEAVQRRIEGARDWQVLLKEDASQTASSGDDYNTAKNLPSDFSHFIRRTEYQPQMLLINGSGAKIEYKATAFSNRYTKNGRLFVVDMADRKFYLLGAPDSAYTIHLYYIHEPDAITSGTSWVFPSKFHSILAFEVAALHKGGIDYDEINIASYPVISNEARLLYLEMCQWDSKLQLNNIEDQ